MTEKKIGIDLKEYGAMCEKIDNVESRLGRFIDNEFRHLVGKVDWMLYLVIASMVGVIIDLVLRIVK